MADRNLQALITTSSVIRRQVEEGKYRTGRYQALEGDGYAGPRKAASPETQAARRKQSRWESRRNTCPVCFEAKSVTGECSCG